MLKNLPVWFFPEFHCQVGNGVFKTEDPDLLKTPVPEDVWINISAEDENALLAGRGCKIVL